MAGDVTRLDKGVVGRGVTGALVALVCLVGLMTCFRFGLVVFAKLFNIVAFEGLTFDTTGLEGNTLTEFSLGFERVALDGMTLALMGVFLAAVGCGFFRAGA